MEEQYILMAKRLKECRLEYNYTLEEVGKKINTSKVSVLRWENGERTRLNIEIIKKLAEIYNVNPVWLMGFEVPKYEIKEKDKKILDLSDFSDEDFDFIRKQVEYMRWKKKKGE